MSIAGRWRRLSGLRVGLELWSWCLLCTTCSYADLTQSTAPSWVVAAYLSDADDLADVRRYCLDNLETSSRAAGTIGLAQSGTRRWRMERGRRLQLAATSAGEGIGAGLAGFLQWCIAQAPGRRIALLLLGHGTPVAVLGGAFGDEGCGPGLRLSAGGDPMTTQALADAIATGLVGPQKLDVVFLDCCYGAGIETAAALRRIAHVVVCSSGRVPVPGLRWAQAFGLDAEPAMRRYGESVAVACLRLSDRQVVAVRGDAVDDLLNAFDAFATELSSWGGEYLPLVTLARQRAARWGANCEICDVAQLAAAIAETAPDARGRALARRLETAARASVLRTQSHGRGEPDQQTTAGLGVYFPPPLMRLPEAYARAARTNGYGTWAQFVEHYLAAMNPDGMPPG